MKYLWIRKFEDLNATFIAFGSDFGTSFFFYVSNFFDYDDLYFLMY